MDQDVSGELPDDAARASLPQAIYEFGTSVAVDLQLVSMGWLAAHPAWRYTSIGQSYVTALLDGPPLSALGRDYQNVAPALNQVLNDMLKDDVPGVRMTAGVKSLLLHAARDQALRVRLMYLSRAFSPDVLLSPGFEESGLITAGAVLHLSSRKVSIFDVMTVLWPTVPDKTLLALSRSPRFDDSFARMNERGAKAAHEILNDARKPQLRDAYYDFLYLALEFGPSRTPKQNRALADQIQNIVNESLIHGLPNVEQIITFLGIIVQQPFPGKERDGSLSLEADASPMNFPEPQDISNSTSTNALEWPQTNAPQNVPQKLDVSEHPGAPELPQKKEAKVNRPDAPQLPQTSEQDPLPPSDALAATPERAKGQTETQQQSPQANTPAPGASTTPKEEVAQSRRDVTDAARPKRPRQHRRTPAFNEIDAVFGTKVNTRVSSPPNTPHDRLIDDTIPDSDPAHDPAPNNAPNLPVAQELQAPLEPTKAKPKSIANGTAVASSNGWDGLDALDKELVEPTVHTQERRHALTDAQLHALDQSVSDRQRAQAPPGGPSIPERPPSDVAYEALCAHVGASEQTILRDWAMNASRATGHAEVTQRDLDAVQHTVHALQRLSPQIPMHDKFSALVRFSGLEQELVGPRDARLIVVDMIVGSKIGAVAFLLHQIKPYFSTETAAVWETCKYFVHYLLDNSPAWKTAAELVGRATIQQYFAVREEDAPQTTFLAPMASFVNYLFQKRDRITDFADLALEMQADEISAGQGQAMLVRLTQLAQDVPAPDIFHAQMANAICQLATGCNTTRQWERKWRRGPAREPQVAPPPVAPPPVAPPPVAPPPVAQPQVPQPPVVQPQVAPPQVPPPPIVPLRAKTSALSPNARAMPLLSRLAPATDLQLAGTKFYRDSDLREEHFSKRYEVISWCTKQPSRFQRWFGMPPQHYVIVKGYNDPAALPEALPADMLVSLTESAQPLTEHEVVGLLPCSKDRWHPRGAFIVRFPSEQAQAAMPPNNDVLTAAVKATNFVYASHLSPEAVADPAKERECDLLTHAFSAARAAKRDDLRTANHLQDVAGNFKRFCDEIGTLVSPPKFLPRMLRRRIVMHRTRERISALARYEEHLQAAPFLESLHEYKGEVKGRWDADKHPAEIKTGEIIGKKHGEVVLRVGDTAYKAKATDLFAQCRFTGVVPGDLTAGNLTVQTHGTPRLNVQFKKNPEGKGFFIYTPRVDRFVTGHSTPGKRIRMALNDLPSFDRTPAVFYDWPKGKDAMLTGLAAPLRVMGKMRRNHRDYVVVYNSKSQHHEAFDGRYLFEELVRTGKLTVAEQRLVSGQCLHFARDTRGRTCLVRTDEATLAAGRPLRDAALTRLTAGLPNDSATAVVIDRYEPLPGQWNVLHQERARLRVTLQHDDGRSISIPTEYFLKQHLERGGLLGPPMRANTKITFSQTNAGLTVTAWQSPQLAAQGMDRAQQLAP